MTQITSKINYPAQAIVWDFDGTLFDSLELQKTVLTEVLLRHDIAIPMHEVFINNYHGRLIDSIRRISGTSGALLQKLYEDFIQSEECHYTQPEELFFTDALNLLRRSYEAGLKQVIVSNRPHHNSRLGSPRNLAKRDPLANLVDVVVCGDDNEFCKPDPRMLDTAEHKLNLNRSKLLVIGDQFVDAELASNIGAQVILVSRNGEDIPHLDKLRHRENIHIVPSLDAVNISLA